MLLQEQCELLHSEHKDDKMLKMFGNEAENEATKSLPTS